MIRSDFEIEVCANSLDSVIASDNAGADRVELCDNILEGGTTPSAGLIYSAKLNSSIKIFTIIRPRGGDFLYTDYEMQIMLKDIETAVELGSDGIVIGCLTADGKVDYEKCARLREAAKNLPVTFHRAFDMTADAFQSVDIIKKLGITRILTSGQRNKAEEGIDLISEIVSYAGNEIKIMVGSGVTEDNILHIAKATNAKSFHVSLRENVESGMSFRRSKIGMSTADPMTEFTRLVTSQTRLSNLIRILEKI